MSRLFSSLRFQLIAVVLLSVLPAIVLILYSGFEQRKLAALQAQESTRRLVELVSTQQARVIDEACRLLAALAPSLRTDIGEEEECSEFLKTVLAEHPRYLNLGVIGEDGRIRCSALPLESHRDFSDRDTFQKAAAGGGFAVGSSRFEPTTGKTSINFGFPVRDRDGQTNGVVFAAVDLAWLSDVAAYLRPEGATLTIVDRQGAVLVRYPEPERWVGRVIPNTGVLQASLEKGDKGAVEAEGLDGVRRLYAFTPLNDSAHSTILYTGIPMSTIYAEANRALARNLIALGLVTLLVLVVACWLGHLIVMRRVDTLAGTAERLAAGDLGARTGMPSGRGELEKLGAAFDAMAESLEKRLAERRQMEEALRGSEAKYRALVEQIPVVTYTAALDASRTVLFISPQVESLLGYDPEDICAGGKAWTDRIHELDKGNFLAESFRSVKDRDLFVCEYRMLTFRGRVKWIRDEAFTVLSEAGEPLFIQGVLMDITQQKRFENELVEARNELETRVEQRTRELARANEDLRQSAEKLKSFASSVVHDLKSPAIGAYGLTKLLFRQYGNVLDEKGLHCCEQIMKASEHVAELAEKINVFIATKETPLTLEAVHLGEVLKGLREEFASRLEVRSVRLVEPEGDIVVKAERLSLLRLFRNLIDNALKYGGDRLSEIRIAYEESEPFHIFSVSDDGRGISSDDTEKIFQMFQRSTTPSGVEGAGLGLSIVREVAEKHGGSVSVDSKTGKGVTFRCSFSKDL